MKFAILTISSFAMLSAVTAATPEEQKILQLTRANDQRVAQLRRSVEATWSWQAAKKAKNFAEINSNVTEIVRLVSLKEGAAKSMTVADAKLLLAQAYAKPINLRFVKEARQAFDEAIALAPADRKASFETARAQYLFDIGASTTPVAQSTAKPAASDQMALLNWYREQLRDSRYGEKVDPLDKANCPDGKLELCDQALAELTDPKKHTEFRLRKAEILLEMSRWADAEKIYLDELAKIIDVKSTLRAFWYQHLAEVYVKRAERYYEKYDAALMEKAVWHLDEAVRVEPKNTRLHRRLVELALLTENYSAAAHRLDGYVSTLKDRNVDAWAAACYGDVAYFTGDYAAAADWYGRFERFPDAPSRLRIPNSHQRYAGALYALGRYEDCLKALEGCPNYWSFKDTNAFYRRCLNAKIEAAKQK